MGNQLAASGSAAAVNLSDISDNARNLQLVAPLGGVKRGRLFTSLHCRQTNSTTDVVIKVFVQRPEDKVQAAAINVHQDALQMVELQMRKYFKENPEAPCNLLFYTQKNRQGGYCLLQRPYIHYSLAERLQMRPFWEPRQRLFACYQLLQALVQLHEGCRCTHGDLKPENVLFSSQDWLYITDFCPFKPPLLPTNNPANFEFFYDNAETRNCCCAPEKFSDNAAGAVYGNTPQSLLTSPNEQSQSSPTGNSNLPLSTNCSTAAGNTTTAAADSPPPCHASSPTERNHRLLAALHQQHQGGAASLGDTANSLHCAIRGAATATSTSTNQKGGAVVQPKTTTSEFSHHLASADVFAAACVIVFILTDEPMFKLSGALEFRSKTPQQRRDFLTRELKQRKLTDERMIEMLCFIMCCEASDRPSASHVLRLFTPTVFPNSFPFLHSNVIPALQTRAPDAQVLFLFSRLADVLQTADRCALEITKEMLQKQQHEEGGGSNPAATSSADAFRLHVVQKVHREYIEEMGMNAHAFKRLEEQRRRIRAGMTLVGGGGGGGEATTAASSSELAIASSPTDGNASPFAGSNNNVDVILSELSTPPNRSTMSSSPPPESLPPSTMPTSTVANNTAAATSTPELAARATLASLFASLPPNTEARCAVVTLLLPYLTSVLRYVRSTDARCRALLIMRQWVPFASEHGRRDIILPWARQVLQSRRAGLQARVQAVRTLKAVLVSLPNLSTNEAFLFEDYILEVFETILREPGVLAPQATNSALPTASTMDGVVMLQPMLSLLTEIAGSLPQMLLVGCSYVRQRQKFYSQIAQNAASRKRSGGGNGNGGDGFQDEDDDDGFEIGGKNASNNVVQAVSAFASFDNELREVVDRGWEVLKMLLSTNQSAVAVAALKEMSAICNVLGQERVTSELLPILTTFLSSTAVEVKAEFLRQIPSLGAFLHGTVSLGAASVGANAPASFLSMVIEDGLRQADVACICAALAATRIVAETKVIPTEILMPTVNTALRHLHSPNTWVQGEACALIETVARQYSPSELLLHVARPMLGRLRTPVPLVHLSKHKDALKPFWEVDSNNRNQYSPDRDRRDRSKSRGSGGGDSDRLPVVDPFANCYAPSFLLVDETSASSAAGTAAAGGHHNHHHHHHHYHAGHSGGSASSNASSPYPWNAHSPLDVNSLPASAIYTLLVSSPQPPCADFLAAVYDPSRIIVVGRDAPVRASDEQPISTSHIDIYSPCFSTLGGGASQQQGSNNALLRSVRTTSVAPSVLSANTTTSSSAGNTVSGGGTAGTPHHPSGASSSGGAAVSGATASALALTGAPAVAQRLLQTYEGFSVSVQPEAEDDKRRRLQRDARRAHTAPAYKRLAAGGGETALTSPNTVVSPSFPDHSPKESRYPLLLNRNTVSKLLTPWRMNDFKPTNRQRKRIEVREFVVNGGLSAFGGGGGSALSSLSGRSQSVLTHRTSTATPHAVGGSSNTTNSLAASLFAQWDQQNFSAIAGLNATPSSLSSSSAGGPRSSVATTRGSVFHGDVAPTERSFSRSSNAGMGTPAGSSSGGGGGSAIGSSSSTIAPLRPIAAPLATYHGVAWDPEGALITCMSAGGNWLVTGGTKGHVALWDVDAMLSQHRCIPRHYNRIVPQTESLLFAQFTYNMSSPIVLGATDGALRLFDHQTDALYATHAYPEEGAMVACTRLTPNVTLVGSHSGSLFAVDWRMRSPYVWKTHLPLRQGAATSMMSLHHYISPTSTAGGGLGVASASGDPTMGDPYGCCVGTTEGFISLYDLRFRINVKSFSVVEQVTTSSIYGSAQQAIGGGVGGGVSSPGPSSFGSNSNTRTSMPNLATGQLPPAPTRVSVLSLCADPRSIQQQQLNTNNSALSPTASPANQGPSVVVSTSDGNIQRFDLQTGERTLQLKPFGNTVTRVLMQCPRTPLILSASEDRLIRLWDFANPAASRTLACLPQRSPTYDYNIRTGVFAEGDPFANNALSAGGGGKDASKEKYVNYGGQYPYGATTLTPRPQLGYGVGGPAASSLSAGGLGSSGGSRYFAGNAASSSSGIYSSNSPIDPHHSDHITAMAVLVNRNAQYLASASRDGTLRVWSNQPVTKN